MLVRVVLRCAAAAKCAASSSSSLAVRRLSTAAASEASSASAAPTAEAILANIGRDIPLKVVPREARRQARKLAKQAGAGDVKHGVRTASLPSRISLAVLGGSITGSIVWHFVLDDGLKKSIADTLGATFLGDIYAFAGKKVEEVLKPWTDPSRAKLLPVGTLANNEWEPRRWIVVLIRIRGV